MPRGGHQALVGQAPPETGVGLLRTVLTPVGTLTKRQSGERNNTTVQCSAHYVMTDESNATDDSTDSTNPYSIPGVPPIPFEDSFPPSEDGEQRGETVHVVIDLGRPNEEATVDRVFYDAKAAQHHADRIEEETHLPTMVIPAQLE